MADYVFKLTLPYEPDPDPVNSEDSRASANRIARLFQRVASGDAGGTATIVADTEATAASAVVTCAAVVSANTVTINGQALTATSQRARGTATCASVVEDVTLTVAGVTFTVKDVPDEEEPLEIETGSTDTEMAENFAAAINANATTSALVKATNVAGVVHIKALAVGTGGNAITLAETGSTITVSGSGTLAGGAAVANNQFDFHAAFDDDTATALAEAINASTTDVVEFHVSAAASGAAVTITARTPGHTGNGITLATSGATLAITGGVSRLAGGAATRTSMSF